MVAIRRSELNKVTIEFTTEELSAVENDLDVHVSDLTDRGEEPSHATEVLLLQVKQFWLGLEPRMMKGND
jgi:hypothetical protein